MENTRKTKTIEIYEIYISQKMNVKKIWRAQENFEEKMKRDSQDNQRLFYKILKTLRNKAN